MLRLHTLRNIDHPLTSKMKSSDIIRRAMKSEIKRARELLSQGLHDPTVMETLDTLNESLKFITRFETKLLSELDVD